MGALKYLLYGTEVIGVLEHIRAEHQNHDGAVGVIPEVCAVDLAEQLQQACRAQRIMLCELLQVCRRSAMCQFQLIEVFSRQHLA
ncbi:hypothetical protein D3C76_1604220 [compost metagenome]